MFGNRSRSTEQTATVDCVQNLSGEIGMERGEMTMGFVGVKHFHSVNETLVQRLQEIQCRCTIIFAIDVYERSCKTDYTLNKLFRVKHFIKV